MSSRRVTRSAAYVTATAAVAAGLVSFFALTGAIAGPGAVSLVTALVVLAAGLAVLTSYLAFHEHTARREAGSSGEAGVGRRK